MWCKVDDGRVSGVSTYRSDEYSEYRDGVNSPDPGSSEYAQAAQNVLDAQAKSMGYDSILTAVSYVGDLNQEFNDEAVALKAWRSDVWAFAYAELALVIAGEIAQPTIEEFKASLPVFTI